MDEIKGFKYQITVKVLLKKYTLNGEIEFAPIYFNSVTKLVINNRFKLEKSFQEILYRIDALHNAEYINVLAYRPLLGNSCINLPTELRNPKKD